MDERVEVLKILLILQPAYGCLTRISNIEKFISSEDDDIDIVFGGWILNEECDVCMICNTPFSTIWNPKHHCR